MRGLRPPPQTHFFCPGVAEVYICYVDESGVPQRSGTSHFVLLGVAIPAATWRHKDVRISAIKLKNRLGQAEIHTAWMARKYPEQARVAGFLGMSDSERRKAVTAERKNDLAKARLRGEDAVKELARNYRKSQAYIHLAHDERIAVLREIADEIGKWDDARMFADAQKKAASHPSVSDDRIFEYAFESVISRFHWFLENTNSPVGILVQDNNQTAAKNLTQLMRRFHTHGTRYISVPRLVETPLFVDSELTSMVQIADLCSYATRRYFENGERDLFDRIYSVFDRNNGKLVGLRHYVGKENCVCTVCIDHKQAPGAQGG